MHDKKLTWFSYFVIGFVVVVAVVGVVFVGFPHDERARRFDERRVMDLQVIQSQVMNYWQRSGTLPEDRIAIVRGATGISFQDPETRAFYEYRVIASTTFALCATFNQRYDAEPHRAVQGGPYPIDIKRGPTPIAFDGWSHGPGRFCFERTIDPTLYYPAKQSVATGGCLITGCSGQVCAETEVVTTCEFQPEYACYKQYSRCERQTDGQCGWTHSAELGLCLYGSPPLPAQ
jgi:hypothetical protein